jgi:hypothetical protein
LGPGDTRGRTEVPDHFHQLSMPCCAHRSIVPMGLHSK